MARLAANTDKLTSDYAPTFLDVEGDGPFVNAEHAAIVEAVSGVHGHLQDADAHKLYEMAYWSPGPILEIGCLHGKSATIMALAQRAAGGRQPLVCVDIDPEHCRIALANVRRQVPDADITMVVGDSGRCVAELELEFAFAFVDGNHRYGPVRRDLLAVDSRLLPGAFVLLHDYYDSRNSQPEGDPRYGVVRAAEELLREPAYAFRGRYGCTALYQKDPRGAPIVDGRSWLRRLRERVRSSCARA